MKLFNWVIAILVISFLSACQTSNKNNNIDPQEKIGSDDIAKDIKDDNDQVSPAPEPPVADISNDQTIVVLSDLNGSYGSMEYSSRVHAAVEKIIELKPDLVLITGDMVAGQKRGLNYEGMWQAFKNAVTTPLSMANIPILVTPGNHDASAFSSFAGERKIYKNEWLTYKNDVLNSLIETNDALKFLDVSNYPFYYSVINKETLYISMDATTTNELSNTQKSWIVRQLQNSEKYKNIIMYSHMPMHPVAQNRENDYIRDSRNSFFKQLKKLGVTHFLSGHHHAYYPGVYDGVKFISQSCIGSGARSLISQSSRSPYSITVLELDEKGHDHNNALIAPRFSQKIARNSLPRMIESPKGGFLVRDDLAQ